MKTHIAYICGILFVYAAISFVESVTAEQPSIAPAPSLPPKFVVGDMVQFPYSYQPFTVKDVQVSARGYNVDVMWYESTTGTINTEKNVPQACFTKYSPPAT